jgi:hypothetical protein
MQHLKDMTGRKFGKLTALTCIGRTKDHKALWLCQCDCGNFKVVRQATLNRGEATSCGCNIGKWNITHGMTKTRIYREWQGMKSRCYYQKNIGFDNYGGRGIKVCNDWKGSFESFYKWAIENGYSDELTLDRKNPNGNYEPNNCRWVSNAIQQNNKRNNHLITYKGKTQSISEWAREKKIDRTTLSKRIENYHWSIEKSLSMK